MKIMAPEDKPFFIVGQVLPILLVVISAPEISIGLPL